MLQLKNINKTFSKNTPNEVKSLVDINLTLADKSFTLIIGSNGSGKSTLLNTIAGTVTPDSGSITLFEEEITALPDYKRSAWIARIFQNPLMGTAPDLTLLENFRLASLRNRSKGLHWMNKKQFSEQVAETLKSLQMGLENKLNQNMGSFSGGQRQALSLLMATYADLKLLLLDEPTAALDPRSAEMVLNLTQHIVSNQKITALMVTHDMRHCERMGDRVIQMHQGQVIRDVSLVQNRPNYEELMAWFK